MDVERIEHNRELPRKDRFFYATPVGSVAALLNVLGYMSTTDYKEKARNELSPQNERVAWDSRTDQVICNSQLRTGQSQFEQFTNAIRSK